MCSIDFINMMSFFLSSMMSGKVAEYSNFLEFFGGPVRWS